MRSFIFDFNGTLYQDSPMHLAAWRRFYQKYQVPFEDDMFYRYMCGPPNNEIIRRMMGADISDAEADRLSEEKEGFYREIVYAAPSLQVLTPGAEEMLDHLKARGIPFAIATGSIKTNVDFYMNTLRIDRWFDYDHIFYAHDDIPGKPDPAVYRLAMEKLGYRPEDTVVVEDGLAGVQSAVGAGVKSVIAIDTTLGPDAFRGIPEVIAVIHDFYGFDRFIDMSQEV